MLTDSVPVLQAYCRKHNVQVQRAVDAGCAGGESTRWLADSYPEAQVTGVDISAHFLALAELRRRWGLDHGLGYGCTDQAFSLQEGACGALSHLWA